MFCPIKCNLYFWFFVVWNLVVIAAERYLAVCQPFKHNNFTKRKIHRIFVLIYVMAILLESFAAFEVSESVDMNSDIGLFNWFTFVLPFLIYIQNELFKIFSNVYLFKEVSLIPWLTKPHLFHDAKWCPCWGSHTSTLTSQAMLSPLCTGFRPWIPPPTLHHGKLPA